MVVDIPLLFCKLFLQCCQRSRLANFLDAVHKLINWHRLRFRLAGFVIAARHGNNWLAARSGHLLGVHKRIAIIEQRINHLRVDRRIATLGVQRISLIEPLRAQCVAHTDRVVGCLLVCRHVTARQVLIGDGLRDVGRALHSKRWIGLLGGRTRCLHCGITYSLRHWRNTSCRHRAGPCGCLPR